jgi:hypothetical protein
MIVKPQGTQGLILVGTHTAAPHMLFFQHTQEQPCLELNLDIGVLAAPQISEFLSKRFEVSSVNIEINMNVAESAQQGTIYVAMISGIEVDKRWLSFPAILRAMPKDRNRIDFLRVWQHLCGSQMSQTQVKEIEDITKVLMGAPHDS